MRVRPALRLHEYTCKERLATQTKGRAGAKAPVGNSRSPTSVLVKQGAGPRAKMQETQWGWPAWEELTPSFS